MHLEFILLQSDLQNKTKISKHGDVRHTQLTLITYRQGGLMIEEMT